MVVHGFHDCNLLIDSINPVLKDFFMFFSISTSQSKRAIGEAHIVVDLNSRLAQSWRIIKSSM